MSRTPYLSIVLPVYNERENLAPLLSEVADAFGDIDYEVVAVDDCSTDGSFDRLRVVMSDDTKLRVLALERRVGQSGALAAGFDASLADLVLTMDADGQSDPADGRRMLDLYRRGESSTAIIGYRVGRVDSRWKRVQSRVANLSRDAITADRVRDTGCSLKLMRRAALRRIPRFDGMHRFLPTLLKREGETVIETGVRHRPRKYGVSKYGMWRRLFLGVHDAFGVRWLGKRGLVYEVRPEGPAPRVELPDP